MTMFEQFEEIRRRVSALEQARVPPGPPEHRDLAALDKHFDARCDTLSKRVDALEHENRVLFHNASVETGIREDIGRRVEALEARMPNPRPIDAAELASLPFRTVFTPLAATLEPGTPQLCATCLTRHRPGQNTLCPEFRAAHDGPNCVQCRGPVEPDRHCYVHPTCYRCLPPPEPLPIRQIGPGAVAPHNLALPDYLLAPAPDYATERPAEVDTCGCDEAVELRQQLAAANALLAECYHYQNRLPRDCVHRLSAHLAAQAKEEPTQNHR